MRKPENVRERSDRIPKRSHLYARRFIILPVSRNHIKWLLLVILLAGLAFRLYLVSERNWANGGAAFKLEGDEDGYHAFAIDLFAGNFFRWPFRVPVYPLFIGAVYWCFGPSPAAVLVVQALLGTLSILLTYMLGRYITTRNGAIIAAALVAASYEMAYQTTRLYTEALFTVLLLLMLISFYRALRRPTAGRFTAGGLLLGVMNLCRPTAVLLPIAMAIVLPWRWPIVKRARLAIVFGLAMLLPIAPWTYHNWRQYHSFLPLAVSTAVLWQGSPAFYHRIQQGASLLDVWKTDLNPAVNGGHSPHTIEGDRYFHRRAMDSIKAEPVLWVWYCVQKSIFLWIGNPAIDWPFQFRSGYSAGRAAGIFTARVLVAAAAVALIALVARFQWRLLRRFLPMLMVCLYFTTIHGLTFPEARYSYPLHPVLALLIGAAAVRGWRSVKRRAAYKKARRLQPSRLAV